MKKLLTIGLSVLLMLCMGISLVGCFPSPKTGNKKLHGNWYVSRVKYDEIWYNVEKYNIHFSDKDYPLTYDCFMLNFLETGKVELHGAHFETLTGTLTNFVNGKGLYSLECCFEFTLGDKSYSGYIEQIGGFMADPIMNIQGEGQELLAVFERVHHGYSYDEYKQNKILR